MTKGFAVARQFIAFIIGDFHFHPKRRAALLDLYIHLLVEAHIFHTRLKAGNGAERREFGHTPRMFHRNIIIALKFFKHDARHGRAANRHIIEHGQFQIIGFQMLQQHQPNGRHGGGKGHFFIGQKLVNALAIHIRAGIDDFRTGCRRAQSKTPRIGVKHRHDGHNAVGAFQPHDIARIADKSVQHIGAVSIANALRIACCAGSTANAAGSALIDLDPIEIAVLSVD